MVSSGVARYEMLIRTCALLLAAFLYVTGAIYHGYLVNEAGVYPPEWGNQALVVTIGVAAAFILFASSALIQRNSVTYFAWIALCILHVLVGYASTEAIFLRLLLFLILMILLAGCFDTSVATRLAVLTFAVYAWFERERYAWNEIVPSADTPVLLVSGAIAIGVTVCVLASRIAIDRIIYRTRVHKDLIASLSDLVSINLDLQEYALHSGEQSRAEERNRISREIHDSVGYSLTTIMMLMEAGRDLSGKNPERVRQFLDNARQQAQDALQDTRASLHALRQYKERSVHGARTLHQIVQTINNATNVVLHAEYSNLPLEMSREAETFLGRFIQEGFTNAVRHGHASEIYLSFWHDRNGITVKMIDNGRGLTGGLSEGIGFQGMRERVDALGGWFAVSTARPETGVQISAFVPNEVVLAFRTTRERAIDERP